MDNKPMPHVSRLAVLIIVLIVVGAALTGYSAYGYYTAPHSHSLTVTAGDQVLVNYIGQYTNGLVFDTSIYSVAVNNATYPKAPGFDWRGAAGYTPLNITSVGNGEVIAGFQSALIGMAVNQTKTVLIPPSLGYGPLNASLLQYLPVYENITMLYRTLTSTFESEYGITPSNGMVFTVPFWGWQAQILSTGNGTTVYQYLPHAGQVVYPYTDRSSTVAGLTGWPVEVVSVNSGAANGSGEIEIKNMVTPSMVGTVGGVNTNGSQFTVWALNSNGTITLNFNKPVVGRTLVFTLTVVFIENPTTGKKAGTP
ncbi:MAG: FKBP-type peptidyl-prolyl cis-trans isomerase [Methanomassiliicoccales archaeon]